MRESDLIKVNPAPGTERTPAGLVVPADALKDVPEGYGLTPGGVAYQQRVRFLCRYCGAAHGDKVGCELHESQCREQARMQWVTALLSGPAAVQMTPEQMTACVRAMIIEHEKRERSTWVEPGDPRY